MSELQVIGWTDFDSEYPTRQLSQEELREVLELLAKEITKNGYIFAGEDHQYSLTGVPVFSDGTCFRASMRAWGLFMAQIYSDKEVEEMSYMDFYMSLGDNAVMPEYIEIEVEPAGEGTQIGMFIQQDYEMVAQSVSFGIELMTTDKVLKMLYKILESRK